MSNRLTKILKDVARSPSPDYRQLSDPCGGPDRDFPKPWPDGPKPQGPNHDCVWEPQACECFCEPNWGQVNNLSDLCTKAGGECILAISPCEKCDSLPNCGRGIEYPRNVCSLSFICNAPAPWGTCVLGKCLGN